MKSMPAWGLLLLLAPHFFCAAQDSAFVAEKYEKAEYDIPMRDGITLHTVVYTPRDTSVVVPILMERTPYCAGPYGKGVLRTSLGPSTAYLHAGYIFVYQDVRGTYLSEGTFENMTPHRDAKRSAKEVDESSDTYDTITWLLQHLRHHNGRVGLWGISYPGFYASAGSINAHPALVAVSPQAPIADWFLGDDDHHHGAFFLLDNFSFSASFDQVRPTPTATRPRGFRIPVNDAYTFFLTAGPSAGFNRRYFNSLVPYWDTIVAHTTYDAYWKAHNILPHLRHMPPAVLIVGGWFDAEDLYGTLHTYATIERNNPGITNTLVMGPWSHGGWTWADGASLGRVGFGAPTAAWYRDSVEFPFFQRWLKGISAPPLPEALVFETGSNQWRRYAAWPPPSRSADSLLLAGSSRLVPGGVPAGSPFDEYISDPSVPVPYEPMIRSWRGAEYMIADQRFASRRPDVLSFATSPLATPLTMAGPITARLFVSSTGTDGDWVVKVIDVFPDTAKEDDDAGYLMTGYQMLVRAEVMPARFREGFEKAIPLQADSVVELRFSLNDVNHCFLPGHRVMVQIQNSWYPLVDRNPQQFLPPHTARADQMVRARQRVWHTAERPSGILFSTLP